MLPDHKFFPDVDGNDQSELTQDQLDQIEADEIYFMQYGESRVAIEV